MKMDLSVMRQDKWQNREVYVGGAKQGDLRSKWVKMLAVKIK
jgi:hypothetical protein